MAGETAEIQQIFDLATLTPGRPFAGMAAGEFIDMRGKEFEIGRDELEVIAQNTRDLIEQYKARNMPGLPIDARRHDNADAAGWITGVEGIADVVDSDGEQVPVIRLLAEWTSLGRELLGERIFANFSPTIDLGKKVIVGGSLTNWPATVDKAGVPLFEAVELQQGGTVYAYSDVTNGSGESAPPADFSESIEGDDMADKEKEARQEQPEQGDSVIQLSQQQLDELVSRRVKEQLAEMEPADKVDLAELAAAFGLNTEKAEEMQITHLEQLAQMVEEQANLKWKRRLADMQRQNRYAELAARVTGGSPEAPRGIPADAESIKAELMKLGDDQARFWGGLLETIVKAGLTDYRELGHGKQVKATKQVPEYARASLQAALDAGNSAAEFFAAAGLGDADDYDLSAFEGGK